MFKVNAYVTEIEKDNSYKVDVDGVFSATVTDCDTIDDSVVTLDATLTTVIEMVYGDCDFDSALTTVIEMMYGDCDFDIVKRDFKGGDCCSYVVVIDDE